MEYKDYYKTLGVPRDASQEAIKRAYRRLARKYHPDVSREANAEARFKEVNEANEVLKDPEKRATYDALGKQWRAGQEFRPPPGGGGYHREFRFDTGGTEGFSDFFASLFGGGLGGLGDRVRDAGGRTDRHKGRGDPLHRGGQDQTTRVEISLDEAYKGTSRRLRLDTPASGGPATASRTLSVRIPPGVTEGRRIRLAGQGAPGRAGGPAGDLYLEVKLRPDPVFRPEGRDVVVRLPVAPWEAALGATVQVPTLGGDVSVRIPPGSQTGNRMRLKARGLPGNPPGDQYVVVEIVTPPADTEEAKEAYRRMASAFDFDPRAALGKR